MCVHLKGLLPGKQLSIVVKRGSSRVSLPGCGSQPSSFPAEQFGQVVEPSFLSLGFLSHRMGLRHGLLQGGSGEITVLGPVFDTWACSMDISVCHCCHCLVLSWAGEARTPAKGSLLGEKRQLLA